MHKLSHGWNPTCVGAIKTYQGKLQWPTCIDAKGAVTCSEGPRRLQYITSDRWGTSLWQQQEVDAAHLTGQPCWMPLGPLLACESIAACLPTFAGFLERGSGCSRKLVLFRTSAQTRDTHTNEIVHLATHSSFLIVIRKKKRCGGVTI